MRAVDVLTSYQRKMIEILCIVHSDTELLQHGLNQESRGYRHVMLYNGESLIVFLNIASNTRLQLS